MRFMTLALAVTALAVAAPAIADKGGTPHAGGNGGNGTNGGGGGSSNSSLTLLVLDPDDGGANYGEQVTFEFSTNATEQPFVGLDCYQDGTLVYSASAGFYDGYAWPWNQTFSLGSNKWTAGAADCTATLEYWDGRRMRALTSIPVPVYA